MPCTRPQKPKLRVHARKWSVIETFLSRYIVGTPTIGFVSSVFVYVKTLVMPPPPPDWLPTAWTYNNYNDNDANHAQHDDVDVRSCAAVRNISLFSGDRSVCVRARSLDPSYRGSHGPSGRRFEEPETFSRRTRAVEYAHGHIRARTSGYITREERGWCYYMRSLQVFLLVFWFFINIQNLNFFFI